MSHNVLEEIFAKFKSSFPPSPDLDHSRLKLTTTQIREMISDLNGSAIGSGDSLFGLLKENGYVYIPLEENGSIVFYWIIGITASGKT